ncbi:MAG: binding-protein-dependent transport system inner rane component, partial [Thermomicrobiales bacterium]|nr:binding-protein-dependent transport system inner rane component [Thermomicrobiales bacterium]
SLERSLGLDKPIWEQYVYFMRNLSRGDLGISLLYRQPVRELVLERLPATLWLVVYSAVLAVMITVPLAILAARQKDRAVDQAIRGSTLLTLAMPSFWVGIIFMMFFSLRLGLFPVSGLGEGVRDRLYHLFLPSLTVALSLSAILIRSLRSSIIAVTLADFVETARAKGLTERRIMLKHILRNALISTITILGVNIGWLIGGTVVIENLFAIPGLGALMLSSISGRDYPMVQGITLVFAVLVVGVNILTDLTYAIIDPRVRL